MQFSNKQKYQELCEKEDIPLQAQYWWFEAVADKQKDWDVLLYLKNEEIIAALPYFKKKTPLGSIILPAPIAAYSFMYVKKFKSKPSHFHYSLQREAVFALFKEFDSFSFFKLNLHPQNSNWLPFSWLGFSQTTRCTYLLDLKKDKADIYANFKHNVRKNIKKAHRNFSFRQSEDFTTVQKLLIVLYEKQNMKFPYSLSATEKLEKELKNRKKRVIFVAGKEEEVKAGVYFAYDDKYAVCLYTASDRDDRKNGIVTGLYWEAIQHFHALGLEVLDFDGTMLQNVEPLYTSFGAVQHSYHSIYKAKNKFLHLLAIGLNKF